MAPRAVDVNGVVEAGGLGGLGLAGCLDMTQRNRRSVRGDPASWSREMLIKERVLAVGVRLLDGVSWGLNRTVAR